MNKHNHGYFSALFAGVTFLMMCANFFTEGKVAFPFMTIVPSIISIYLGYLSFKERCDDKVLGVLGISVGIFCLIAAAEALFFP